jgi:hypothetical protein
MDVRSFLLGSLTSVPLLAAAWIAGRTGSESPRGESDVCVCSAPHRLDARSLLDAVSALRSSTSSKSVPATTDAGMERDADPLPQAGDQEAAARIETEIRRCFAGFWRLTVDESDDVATLVRDSGKSPLDPDIRESVTSARRRLIDSKRRCESELRAILARRPTMTISIKELEERKTPAAEAFHRELDDFNETRGARVAAQEKEKAEILAELAKALGAKG